jgi:HSP20 family protein
MMQSKQAVQTQAESAKTDKKTTNSFLVDAEKIFDRMKELYQAIERRAYDLFAERGYKDGYALEDWSIAESEFLMNIPVALTEEESSILVRAEVPGFEEKNIQVSVEPRRLVINGNIEHSTEGKEEGTLTSSKEFFCSFELPCEIETTNPRTTLKDGILEISLPRLNSRKDINEETKQA